MGARKPYAVRLEGAPSALVMGRQFAVYLVGGECEWFFVHSPPGRASQYVVSHKRSGQFVCGVPGATLHACRWDIVAAGRIALDEKEAQIGPEQFWSSIAAAPGL